MSAARKLLLVVVAASCNGLPTEPGWPPLQMQATRLAVQSGRPCLLQRIGEIICWKAGTPVLVTPGDDSLRFAAISGMTDLLCGLTTDSTAYCWGTRNTFGEIGDGTRTLRENPTRVLTNRKFIYIFASMRLACALDPQGKAYCWGDNIAGGLGNGEWGEGTEKLQPYPVLTSVRFRELNLSIDGRAFGWGGLSTSRNALWDYPVHAVEGDCHRFYYWLFTGRPCLVPTPVKTELRFATSGITAEGDLYTWGDGWAGGLGDGRIGCPFCGPVYAIQPVRVLGDIKFKSRSGTCALDITGKAYCWGGNFTGRLGIGTYQYVPRPTPVSTDERFVEIVDNGATVCARTAQDDVWCWGDNFGTLPLQVPLPKQ